MKYTTRFNPTVNGEIHLGHLYNILVNQAEAQRSGGKFIIRFDDTQGYWNRLLGAEKVNEYRRGMIEDLDWLGIHPDKYESQVDMMSTVEAWFKELHYEPEPEYISYRPTPRLAGCNHHFYPYTDRYTAEKVIMDALEGVNYLIRGLDLITEESHYVALCRRLNCWPPLSDYLPRLDCGNGEISKTLGKYKLCDFRKAGYSRLQLLHNLAHDCLQHPSGILQTGSWFFDNVKANPKVGAWADEVMREIGNE